MSLLDHTIWWHVYPLGATGAPIRDVDVAALPVENRLERLIPWLDHLIELGCNGLLLAPIFASSTHGYDTLDHFRIDPRLGDDAAFDHLIAEASRRGIAVMLDGVFNHVGAAHPLVESTLREGHGPVAVEHTDHGPRPRAWEGHGDLAELDHDAPETADLVTEIMLHWLRRGIAGWRLDVAYAVPAEFWATVTARVRQEFPDALFLGEVIHGDYPRIIAESHLDTLTQYELWKGVWSSLADTNMWELDHALQRHADFCRTFVPTTFVGNHDVDRIADKVGDDAAALAAVVLLTVPGMPCVYYGDEHAFRGAKGQGFSADDSVRPLLPAHPGELSPLGQWMFALHQRLIGLRRRHPWLTRGTLSVVDKQNEWITYEVAAPEGGPDAGRRLRVELVAAPTASARVTVDGAEELTWQAGE